MPRQPIRKCIALFENDDRIARCIACATDHVRLVEIGRSSRILMCEECTAEALRAFYPRKDGRS